MANLQVVIASVLRDVLLAQHEANLLTEALAKQYREAGVLSQLNLPAVTIGDMELSFRLGMVTEDDIVIAIANSGEAHGATPHKPVGEPQQQCGEAAASDTPSTLESIASMLPSSVASMEVIVDAEQLAALPESVIQSVTLKVSTQGGVKITDS